jgi:hypothetical protein
MSYTRADDNNTEGYLSKFREKLCVRVALLCGYKEFPIFQDKYSILEGQDWQERAYEGVDAACVFIAIMTPAFFQSDACRGEVERFHQRATGSQNPGLLLPIYYVTAPQLDDSDQRNRDSVARLLRSRQYADWRELRDKSIASQATRVRIDKLAQRIKDFIAKSASSPQEERGLADASPVGDETIATLQQIVAELSNSSFRRADPTILVAKTIEIRGLLARRVLAHPTRPSEVAQALDALRQVLDSIVTTRATGGEIISGCDQAERLRKLLMEIILD